MATKTNKAMSRLMGRLTALRQTLRKDERDILDRFVLGATVNEVVAHRLATQPEPAVSKKAADRVTPKANTGAQPEVAAHGMTSKVQPAVSKKAADRANMRVSPSQEPEVVAHGMTSKVQPAVSKKAADRANMRVSPSQEPEVAAHGMTSGAVAKAADGKVAAVVSARVDWDAEKKQYRVMD